MNISGSVLANYWRKRPAEWRRFYRMNRMGNGWKETHLSAWTARLHSCSLSLRRPNRAQRRGVHASVALHQPSGAFPSSDPDSGQANG